MSDDLTTKITQLTTNIDKNERKFPSLLERANLYQRQKKFDAAVADVAEATKIAESRGKREDIGKCHFRLALVLYSQKQISKALAEINTASELNCKESTLEMWRAKIEYDLKRAAGDTLSSNTQAEVDGRAAEKPGPTQTANGYSANTDKTNTNEPSTSFDAINKVAPLKVKIRDDWYQNNDEVVITIFAKNIKEPELEVDFTSNGVHVSFPTGGGSQYSYNMEPLFSEINVSESSYRVFGTKLEITMKKASSQKWPTLEASSAAATQYSTVTQSSGLSYPSSSKRAINWANFSVEDDETDKNENEFFSKLYADTDDDSRRAMMKSYVESNGTVLTTNWDEAKQKTFETSPPEGMVPKKWSQ